MFDLDAGFRTGLQTGLVVTLVPSLMYLLGSISPPAPPTNLEPYSMLRRRYGWVDFIGCALFFVPLGLSIYLLDTDPKYEQLGWPILGLTLGACTLLPNIWYLIVTLPFGANRYAQFWRFYQRRYKVGTGAIVFLFAPGAIFGALAIFELSHRGFW